MADRDRPATKGDLEGVKTQVNSRFDKAGRRLEDFKVEVNTRFAEFDHRMEQLLSGMEGRIVTSVYRLAESMQQRLVQVAPRQP